MGGRTLYRAIRAKVLYAAWRKVRQNGLSSPSQETREAIKAFDAESFRHIRRIERQLRQGQFRFKPQKGIAKKRPGKKPRPLVVAAVENRIVQRAILDVLQREPAIRKVLETPTSFGGIKKRGRQHAIATVLKAIQDGGRYYIRSDIEGFFTKIPRPEVLAFFAKYFHDEESRDLLKRATDTELANLDQLGEDADLFPLGDVGVAQGSPLSPLIGNILLRNFDRDMNGRGITCIRYIDDFILIGPTLTNVRKAFESAQKKLAAFGMRAFDPTQETEKAEIGTLSGAFEFLGCQITSGLIQPTKDARARLLATVEETLEQGRRAMMVAARETTRKLPKQRYAQTLVEVNHIVQGWGHSFAFCNGRHVFRDLDRKIDQKLAHLHRLAGLLAKGNLEGMPRRILGVHLLSDTRSMPLSA